MGRGAFGAQTVISAQLSTDVTLSSAGQNSTTSDEQAADPAAMNCCCPSRREPWKSAIRRPKESCHQPVTTALVCVARPQMALWALGPRMTVSAKESGAAQYCIGRMRDGSPTARECKQGSLWSDLAYSIGRGTQFQAQLSLTWYL